MSEHIVVFPYGSLDYNPEFTVLSYQFWRDMLCMPCFCCSPTGSILILQDQASRLTRWCLQNEKQIFLATLSHELAWSLCCVNSCSKRLCAWWQSAWMHQSVDKLVFKFRILLGVPGAPGPPACLLLQYQTTSFWIMWKARYKEHTVPILMT